MKSELEKLAQLEYDALGDLGEYITNIGGISPLTKAMVNSTIAEIQHTLHMTWGVDVKTEPDPGFFQMGDDLMQQHAVEMRTSDNSWVAVSYSAIEKLPSNMVVRLRFHNGHDKNDTYHEAGGRTEFLLADKAFEKSSDSLDWIIWYQV